MFNSNNRGNGSTSNLADSGYLFAFHLQNKTQNDITMSLAVYLIIREEKRNLIGIRFKGISYVYSHVANKIHQNIGGSIAQSTIEIIN